MGGNVATREREQPMNLDRKRSGARCKRKGKFCFGENRKFVGKEDVNGTVKILSMVMAGVEKSSWHPVRNCGQSFVSS